MDTTPETAENTRPAWATPQITCIEIKQTLAASGICSDASSGYSNAC
jgi:hypothetical protein